MMPCYVLLVIICSWPDSMSEEFVVKEMIEKIFQASSTAQQPIKIRWMGLWEALGNVLGLMHDDALHPPQKSLGDSP